MAVKSTHVDWYLDKSASVRHEDSEDPSKDIRHGVPNTDGVLVSIKRHIGGTKIEYPPDHQPGMRVPKGGSSCESCEYLGDDKKTCTNKYFIKWNGSDVIPGKIDEYCSDWYEEDKE